VKKFRVYLDVEVDETYIEDEAGLVEYIQHQVQEGGAATVTDITAQEQ
jgi:hypothetical protein